MPVMTSTSSRLVVGVLALVAGSLSATSAEKLKVLLVDGQNNHNWKATTPVLQEILTKSGRFDVTVTTSPGSAPRKAPAAEKAALAKANAAKWEAWRPKFSDYDVVVSNYNGQMWPEEVQKAFDAYVSGGGGFVAVHAADNSFPQWEAYNKMIGVGGWGGRNEKSGPYLRWRDGKIVKDMTPGRGGSHGSRHEFVVETRAPSHPIVAGLPLKWMHKQDELYDRLRGPAENVTVLATAWADPKTRGSGEHEPMLMVIDYGKGKVFHTTLGHDTTAMSGRGFAETLNRGTEWVATGKVTFGKVGADQLPADKPAVVKLETAIPGVASADCGDHMCCPVPELAAD